MYWVFPFKRFFGWLNSQGPSIPRVFPPFSLLPSFLTHLRPPFSVKKPRANKKGRHCWEQGKMYFAGKSRVWVDSLTWQTWCSWYMWHYIGHDHDVRKCGQINLPLKKYHHFFKGLGVSFVRLYYIIQFTLNILLGGSPFLKEMTRAHPSLPTQCMIVKSLCKTCSFPWGSTLQETNISYPGNRKSSPKVPW